MVRYILILVIFFNSAHASLSSEWKYSQASNECAKENYVQARELMQSILVHEPNRPDLLYDLGVVSFKNKEFEQASAYFSCATKSEECPILLKEQAYFNLGNTSVELNQLNDAIVHYQQVLELNENNEQAKHNLEVVKKMLEEQEKKQPENKQDKPQDQDQNEDKNNSQDQQDKNSSNGQGGNDDDEGKQQENSKNKKEDPSQNNESKDSNESKKEKNKQEQNKNQKDKKDSQDQQENKKQQENKEQQENKNKKNSDDQSKKQKPEQNKQPSDKQNDKPEAGRQ